MKTILDEDCVGVKSNSTAYDNPRMFLERWPNEFVEPDKKTILVEDFVGVKSNSTAYDNPCMFPERWFNEFGEPDETTTVQICTAFK